MPLLATRMLLAFALLVGAGGALRAQATVNVALQPRACTFYVARDADPVALAARDRPPCHRRRERVRDRASIMLAGGLWLTAERGDPLEFSHAVMRLDSERVLFRYADGVVLESPTPPPRSFRPLTTTEMYFAIPWRPVPLTAVLVRTTGIESRHGLAARARIAPASVNAGIAMRQHLLYGLFGGAIVALLIYNLLLWRGLRYGFLKHYAVIGLAMLGFGLSWSGLLAAAVPGLDPKRQVMVNVIGYAALIVVLPSFLQAFLERQHRPHRLLRVARWAAIVALVAAVASLAEIPHSWRLLDQIVLLGILSAVMLVLAAGLQALIGGSIAARYFLIAWTVPIGFAIWRTLLGVGLPLGASPLIDVAPLAIMALEAVLGSLGMAWRMRALREQRDDARAIRADLQRLADTDPMTGLLNRRAFLRRATARSSLQQLMLIDIDRFKAINDCMGHEVGDRAIIAIAALLAEQAPSGALVGRMGGEEFAILADIGRSDGLDDTLLRHIATASMPEGLTLTCSAGIALGHVGSIAEWERLYREADRALYRAKAGGRDRLCRPALSAAA